MLFIPGPTEVRREVLGELALPQIGHRTREFRALFSSLRPGLKRLFHTRNDVLISTSSGSGFWEAAIRSCVAANVLHAVNGAFSEKWAAVSAACGRTVARLEIPWGRGIRPEAVDRALRESRFEAFCMVHNETSTGVASGLEGIAAVMKAHPDVLWIVDAVSSLGGIRIEVDRLGIDVCLASSQKALALPPGIALASVSPRAYRRAAEVPGRGYYFDLLELKKAHDRDETPYTPSLPHLFALRRQLERIEGEGLDARFRRHSELARLTRGWAERQGFPTFSEAGFHSDTVSCLLNARKADLQTVRKRMGEDGYVTDPGYGSLNERLAAAGGPDTFRIAHMGDLTVPELRGMLDRFETHLGASET
jgi:predicted phosphoserine aminotransferase